MAVVYVTIYNFIHRVTTQLGHKSRQWCRDFIDIVSIGILIRFVKLREKRELLIFQKRLNIFTDTTSYQIITTQPFMDTNIGYACPLGCCQCRLFELINFLAQYYATSISLKNVVLQRSSSVDIKILKGRFSHRIKSKLHTSGLN